MRGTSQRRAALDSTPKFLIEAEMLNLRVDRWLALYCFRPLRRAFSSAARCRVPILMYHSISKDPEPGVASYYRLCTSPTVFRRQMAFLREQGYGTVDLDALSPLPAAANARNDRLVVITFDDGFRDNLTEALPVLEEFGFTATVYVATAYIRDKRCSFKGRDCLIWPEVREMQARGIRFGSHTVNHPVLYELSSQEIANELSNSRAQLEDRLQTHVTAFAYPYAFPKHDPPYAARFKSLLSENGYNSAVTTTIGCAQRGDDALALRRLPVNSADDLALFKTKLDGAYDWVEFPQHIFKTFKHMRRNTAEPRR